TAGVTRMEEGVNEYQSQLFSGGEGWNEFTLNFPLYNGVKSLRIGLSEGAKVAPPSPYAGPGKVVIYGGSTVQGACASRPGRYHMSIVSRRLNREVVNLGFSGNGKLEPELAEIMAQIASPAILIVEGERNARYEGVVERLETFLQILRRHHPGVPIVVMSANPHGNEWRQPGSRPRILAFQKELVARLRKNDPDVHLFDGSNLLGDDYYECSVDGSHPTDLGFQRMADGLAPFVAALLKPGT
ncbi:MAG TPA: SGNH/GDSL hydrolase family protein, partial [Lentisphaeria bacterium]|nr:SGNH/GDSL hydrolase family protein [Lentisphaeria bacterium]